MKRLLLTWAKVLRIKPLKQEESHLLGEEWSRLFERPSYRRFSLAAAFLGPFWFLYYRMPIIGLLVVLPAFLGLSLFFEFYRSEILQVLNLNLPFIGGKLLTEGFLLAVNIFAVGYGAPLALRYKVAKIVRQGRSEGYVLTSRAMLIYPLTFLMLLLVTACVGIYLQNPEFFLENLRKQILGL